MSRAATLRDILCDIIEAGPSHVTVEALDTGSVALHNKDRNAGYSVQLILEH